MNIQLGKLTVIERFPLIGSQLRRNGRVAFIEETCPIPNCGETP
jgi:hypothetical protein